MATLASIAIFAICLLFVAPAAAQQPSSDNNQLAQLAGTAINGTTKEPIRKAHVTLEVSDESQSPQLIATTDNTGQFRFADVAAGRYRITAEKSGFLEGYFGASTSDEAGSILKVASGDRLTALTVRLFPGAVISGQVLDAGGDPVPDNEVILESPSHLPGHAKITRTAQTNTNRTGEYVFSGLSPGTYYVSASAGAWGYAARQVPVDNAGHITKLRDLTTFYPGVISLSSAAAVNVEGGEEKPGIDIRIQRGRLLNIKGRIATIASSARYSLSATVDDGMGWTSEAGTLLPNGEFVFAELPPGKHRLILNEAGPNGLQMIGKTEVNLLDQDLTGVVITPFKPALVRVRVSVEGEEDKPLTTGSVFLTPAPVSGDVLNTFDQYQPQNGAYVFDDVPPGRYKILFNNASTCYLKALQSGERILDSNSFEVVDGAILELRMTYSRNVANLTGDVQVPQDQSKHTAYVVLISQELEGLAEQKTLWPTLDQSLHFSVPSMRPGKYIAFATEEDYKLWDNTEFVKLLESEGAPIELHEKEQASVHLKLIPKEEIDRIRKQLGL